MAVVPTTQRDDRFLREMMMQCLDDICGVEFDQLMVANTSSTETISVTIPSNSRHLDFGTEWTNPLNGYITMFRVNDRTAVLIVAGCLTFLLDDAIPAFAVTILQGITMMGSKIISPASLQMTVVPTIIRDTFTLGAMTVYDASGTLYYNNILPTLVRHVSSWTIRGVIVKGCTVPLVTNGAMVVYNKLMNGTKYVNDPNEGYIHAIARENTDLVVGTITDTVDGIQASKPVSDGLKNVSQVAIITGLSITAAIVLVNQSQYQWFSDDARPKKRIKK